MIGINHGLFIGYVHRVAFQINKKEHPQVFLTIQQPNPKVASQKSKRTGSASIWGTFVAFDELATQIRDKISQNDFVIATYTIRNWRRGHGGFGHSLQLTHVFPWRPNRSAVAQGDGSWAWDDLVDGPLAEREPETGGEDDGDRAWPIPAG